MEQLQFGPGDAAPLPRIDVTQGDISDSVGLEVLEVKGRDFPLSRKNIEDQIREMGTYSVVVKLNHRCQAWAIFSVEGNDIFIKRISFYNKLYAPLVLEALMEAVAFTPVPAPRPKVVIVWPEHEVDRWVFSFLQDEGWTPCGVSKELFEGYGTKWDGYLLEKQL